MRHESEAVRAAIAEARESIVKAAARKARPPLPRTRPDEHVTDAASYEDLYPEPAPADPDLP